MVAAAFIGALFASTGTALAASPGCAAVNAGQLNYIGTSPTAQLAAVVAPFYTGDQLFLTYTSNTPKAGVVIDLILTSVSVNTAITGATSKTLSLNATVGSLLPIGAKAGITDATALLNSRSVALTVTCTPAPTATSLVVSASPTSSRFGQEAQFTATVSASDGTATGNVVFTIDGVAQPAVALAGGVATLKTSSLAVGSHSVSASYGGTSTFLASSGTLSGGYGVAAADTQTALSSSAGSTGFGAPVTFTATTSAALPGRNPVTGSVIFTIDGVDQSPIALANGSAALTLSNLSAGAHTVNARFVANASFNASSASLSGGHVVTLLSTTTVLTATSVTYGSTSTLTATVSAASGAPTGSVTFTVDGTSYSPVALSSGSANLAVTGLAAGNHSVSAVYSGATPYASSGAMGTAKVAQAPTTISVSPASVSAQWGEPLTLTTRVTSAAGTPIGSVIVTVDGQDQPAQTLNNGEASIALTGLAPGRHDIAARYTGTTNYAVSATAQPSQVTVEKASAQISLTADRQGSILPDEPILFTARVEASAGMPTGNVTFLINGVAIEPVPLVNGEAALDSRFVAPGHYTVESRYDGDSSFEPSTAASLSLSVTAPLALDVATTPVTVGDEVHVAATATGGTGPYVFALSGSLPDGLVFDPQTGQISGRGSVAGAVALTLTVRAADGRTSERGFTLELIAPPVNEEAPIDTPPDAEPDPGPGGTPNDPNHSDPDPTPVEPPTQTEPTPSDPAPAPEEEPSPQTPDEPTIPDNPSESGEGTDPMPQPSADAQIMGDPLPGTAGEAYATQFTVDGENGPYVFALLDAAAGFAIDQSGLLTAQVDVAADYLIDVQVTDASGGLTVRRFRILMVARQTEQPTAPEDTTGNPEPLPTDDPAPTEPTPSEPASPSDPTLAPKETLPSPSPSPQPPEEATTPEPTPAPEEEPSPQTPDEPTIPDVPSGPGEGTDPMPQPSAYAQVMGDPLQGTAGEAYATQFTVDGENGPYVFALLDAAAGFAIDQSGLLTAQVDVAAEYLIDVQVTDASGGTTVCRFRIVMAARQTEQPTAPEDTTGNPEPLPTDDPAPVEPPTQTEPTPSDPTPAPDEEPSHQAPDEVTTPQPMPAPEEQPSPQTPDEPSTPDNPAGPDQGTDPMPQPSPDAQIMGDPAPGMAGETYTTRIFVQGTNGPYQLDLVEAPIGFALDDGGMLTGVAQSPGDHMVEVQATDASGFRTVRRFRILMLAPAAAEPEPEGAEPTPALVGEEAALPQPTMPEGEPGSPSIPPVAEEQQAPLPVDNVVPEDAPPSDPGPMPIQVPSAPPVQPTTGEPTASTPAIVAAPPQAPSSAAEAVVAESFAQLESGFVGNRLGVISATLPLPNILERQSLAGGAPAQFGVSGQGGNQRLRFFSSSAAGKSPALAAADTLASVEPSEQSPFDVWMSGEISLYDGEGPDRRSGQTGTIAVGADLRISPNAMAGVMILGDWTGQQEENEAAEGMGILVGPYLSIALGEHLTFDATALFGGSSNTLHQSLGGVDHKGQFDTTRFYAKGALKGHFDVGALIVRPDAAFVLSSEQSNGFAIADASGKTVTMPQSDSLRYRLTAGATAEYEIAFDDNSALIPMAGFNFGFSGSGAKSADQTAFGRLTTGLVYRTSGGLQMEVNLSGELDQSGRRSFTARASLGAQF